MSSPAGPSDPVGGTDVDVERQRVRDAILGGPRGSASPFPLLGENGELDGPFGLMERFPALGGPLQEVGAAIRYRTSLSARAREIAILTVARLTASSFEIYAHRLVALRCGLSEIEIDALLTGSFSSEDASETGVLRLSEELLADAATARTNHGLDAETVAEVVTLVGYYRLLAQLMAQFDIGAPPPRPHHRTEPV